MKKYKATRAFRHDQLGDVAKGQEFSATDTQIHPVRDFVELSSGKSSSDADEPPKKSASKKA